MVVDFSNRVSLITSSYVNKSVNALINNFVYMHIVFGYMKISRKLYFIMVLICGYNIVVCLIKKKAV